MLHLKIDTLPDCVVIYNFNAFHEGCMLVTEGIFLMLNNIGLGLGLYKEELDQSVILIMW